MKSKTLAGRRRLRIRRERLQQLGRRQFGATTDAALAVGLGVDPSGLCHLLSGRRQPSTRMVVYLLDLFDVEFDDLFERYDPPPRPDVCAAA